MGRAENGGEFYFFFPGKIISSSSQKIRIRKRPSNEKPGENGKIFSLAFQGKPKKKNKKREKNLRRRRKCRLEGKKNQRGKRERDLDIF